MARKNRQLGRGIESLESRTMMAADISLNATTGVLTITGDKLNAYRDIAIVRFDGDLVRVRVDSLRADGYLDNVVTNSFSVDRVKQVVFNGLDGNDGLQVSQSALPTSGRTLAGKTIIFNGGNGDDSMSNSTGLSTTARGGAGADSLYGGTGDDRLYGDAGRDGLHGGEGADTIYGNSGTDYVYGDKGHDYIYGDDGVAELGDADYLYGNDGDDIIHGDGGDDTVHGWGGNDYVYGDGGSDNVFGDVGDDHVYGGAGDDILHGDDQSSYHDGGDDWLQGGAGSDRLYGGGGNDFLQGGERFEFHGIVLRDFDGIDNAVDELYGQGGDDRYEEGRVQYNPPSWKFWEKSRMRNIDLFKDFGNEGNDQIVNWY